MLKFNLQSVFKARGIKRPLATMIKAGLSANAAARILRNETGTMKLSQMEILCRMLKCAPHDLLVWSPDKDVVYADDHPLRELAREADESWMEVLEELPLEELKKVAKEVAERHKK